LATGPKNPRAGKKTGKTGKKKSASRKKRKATTAKAAKKKAAGARKKSARKAPRKKSTGKKPAARKSGARKKVAGRKGATRPSRTGAPASRPTKNHPATIARLYPKRVGTVTHYYAQSQAALIRMELGEMRAGDAVHIRGHTTDFYERIEELRVDDVVVDSARKGQTVGVRITRTVRENDGVFLLSE
jgi:hypothetical protein